MQEASDVVHKQDAYVLEEEQATETYVRQHMEEDLSGFRR